MTKGMSTKTETEMPIAEIGIIAGKGHPAVWWTVGFVSGGGVSWKKTVKRSGTKIRMAKLIVKTQTVILPRTGRLIAMLNI